MDTALQIHPKDCVGGCPVCCYQTLEEYNARLDGQIRNRSLTLANNAAYLLLAAHIFFAYIGKVLPMPEYFYALIIVPYGGAAIKKLIDLVDKQKDK